MSTDRLLYHGVRAVGFALVFAGLWLIDPAWLLVWAGIAAWSWSDVQPFR